MTKTLRNKGLSVMPGYDRQPPMINRIKVLLSGGGSSQSPDQEDDGLEKGRLAAAALLVEAARLDGHFDEDERKTIASLLKDRFGLDKAEVKTLIENAEKAADESNQLYAFTRVIKDRFEHEDRVRMIEMLWEVAYADGSVHEYESNLARRVTGLIHVSDRESGEARKRVIARANEPA